MASIFGTLEGGGGEFGFGGTLHFYTKADNENKFFEPLTLTSSGRVGIGTTAPTRALDVGQDFPGHGRVGFFNLSNHSQSAEIVEIGAGGDGNGCSLQIAKLAASNTQDVFTDASGNVGSLPNYSGVTSNCNQPGGMIVGTHGGGPLLLVTDNKERMRIGGDGNIGIGTATSASKLDINAAGFDSASTPVVWIQHLNNDAPTYAMAVGDEDSAGDMFALRARGDGSNKLDLIISGEAYKPTGGSWMMASDARLKKNIAPLGDPLSRLLRLRGVTFEWIEPHKHGDLTGPQMGMIAQEVEKVFPEWVGTGPDGYKALGFRGFEALTVESFRTLKSENDALRERVADLEKRDSRTAQLEADLGAERAARQKLEARLAALEATVLHGAQSHR